MDIIDRLQEIINYSDLNVSSFAKKIGVVDQTIRGIVVQREISRDLIFRPRYFKHLLGSMQNG